MSLTKVKDQKVILTESLLASISEVMSSVIAVDVELENFMELGSYLHRTSPAIMELRMTENAPSNATEILQSLSTNVEHAKELVAKCSSGAKSIMDDELKNIIKQLEGVINDIGEALSKIPSSTFHNHEYAETAIQSLSREMRNARFQENGIQQSDMVETKIENLSLEETESREEKSLVPMSNGDPRRLSSQRDETPRLVDFLKGMYYGANENNSQSFSTLPQLAEYIEPLYDTFFCPLTKKIMDDPVTIESGATYERRAIVEWFEKSKDGSEALVCPTTGMKLHGRVLNTNIALKTTIAEWKERNEATRIRVARTALSLAASEAMVLDAIRDLKILGRKRRYNREQMHNIGITKLLTRFLEHEDLLVRCEALDILRLLVENEDGKVIIAKTKAIAETIKMLSSNHSSERHASLSFLLELSKSELLVENIGSTAGCILMLITMKYNESTDAFAAEKATETLKNMEKCPRNIKRMAENGLLEPLLNHLVDGSEEVQMEMVSYLGEFILEHDMKTRVAERTSEALIKMVHSGNSLNRKAAFKALVQISSHDPSSKTLANAGVVPIMIEEMFTRRIYNEPMDSKEEAAAVLANILECGIDPETLQVNKHGHTMTSHYSIYNVAHLLKCSMPDKLNVNLIKILFSLTKLPRPFATVVSVIKEAEVCHTIIEFLNSSMEELNIASAKLLITLSTHMGHTIAEGICMTQGQPESLITKLDTDRITKKHAVSVNLLAKLPHQNLTLNLALLEQDIVPIILNRIRDIQRGETRATRHASIYLEGLVGILVRFTATLYEPEILHMAIERNLTSVFTDLLVRSAGSDEVQRLAAVGLENLSSQSINLSKPPEIMRAQKKSFLAKCLSMGSQKDGKRVKKRIRLCPVHRGACSSATTFCLLESKAVERLLGCLDHENPKVVEAALSAICTLLDEKVDVERSVEVLSEVDAVRHVLGVLRDHREDGVWQKSFWVIERFLMRGGDRDASDISNDRVLPSALVNAFQRGDSSTKQVAENILRHLNRMPNFSDNMVM